MNASVLKLRALHADDAEAFSRAVEEYGYVEGVPFAFQFEQPVDFPAYVKKTEGWSRGEGLFEDMVPNTYYVAVLDERIVGRVSIRHRLNRYLERVAGHIGYAVLPSDRGQGHATEMLRLALIQCRDLGIRRALLTCDLDNHASRRVIEKNGGVLEDVCQDTESGIDKLRFWVTIGE